MFTAAIGLGGNLGAVSDGFRQAGRRLTDLGIEILRRSRIFRTAAVGDPALPAYLNAAILVTTQLSPEALLGWLQEIEAELGRQRGVEWGPRPLDLDLIWYDELVVESPRLTLPHPACWYRRFVLDPLCDVAPEWRHPLKARTAAQLLTRFRHRPLSLALVAGTPDQRSRLLDHGGQFAADRCVRLESAQDAPDGDRDLLVWLGPDEPRPGVARPQSESVAADFLLLPPHSRLDASQAQGSDWFVWLLQAITDQPLPTEECWE